MGKLDVTRPKQMHRTTFVVPQEKWEKFMRIAYKEDKTAGSFLRELIDKELLRRSRLKVS